MRDRLSQLLVEAAKADPSVIILTGDHGYALFDALRKERPGQFLNCGIIEQAMVGIAAGLAKSGFKPIVYGLAAFVPMRCLEQIKLDVCHDNLPITFLGDGAGLVYAHLGASHHCGEDMAVLRCLPNMEVYSPANASELEECFKYTRSKKRPAYIRIGKSDRPIEKSAILNGASDLILATGSMSQIGLKCAEKFGLDFFSAYMIKPFIYPTRINQYKNVYVIEEHSKHGGLYSTALESIVGPKIHSLSLKDQFSDKCGSWQYALSEHGISDNQLMEYFNGLYPSNNEVC